MLNDIQRLKKENIPGLSSVVFCMQVKPFVILGVTCSSMWTFGEPTEVWTSWRIITQQAMWQAERSDAGAIWYWTKKDFVTLYICCAFSDECFFLQSLVRISGATDHKTHGSDYITYFESQIG